MVGIVPWIAITIAPMTSQSEGGCVFGCVRGIFVSLIVLFNCFVGNQWRQHRRRGRFADHLDGEKVYLVLSRVAKTPWPGKSKPAPLLTEQLEVD